MSTEEPPAFPHCEVCDSRMNSWSIAVCMSCQLLPDADVVELRGRKVRVA